MAVNAFDSKPVVHCCITCCEELHRDVLGGKSYFRQLPDGSRRPTSVWLRRSRSSASFQRSAKRVEWVLKMHEDKTSGASARAAQIYSAMQSEHFRCAIDWVVEIGGRHAFLWLLYGCSGCQHYPVRSNSWYRVTRNVKEDQLGNSSLGQDFG